MPDPIDLREYIEKAIHSYNKYRGLEANAKVLDFNGNTLIVDFRGTYCQTCGLHDYFEDLIYDLKDLVDVEIKIEKIGRVGDDTYRVRYSIIKEEKEV
ncbi:MAG: hypothetical protein ACFE7A_07120 [Promethearchaeota archaeon]